MNDREAAAVRSSDLLADLKQFTGDLQRWRHPLYRKLIYTTGVRRLAEKASCYWLLDAIASWLGSKEFATAARRDPRIRDIHFWKLAVESDKSAVLTAVADSGEPPFVRQAIEFTDFPIAEINLWCGCENEHWVLYLPSEH